MSKLAGKVALVTGGSKGIGAGIARALASEGAAVVVNYSSSKMLAEEVVNTITQARGRAVSICADVTKRKDAQALVDATVTQFGRLDILVNNSGAYRFGRISDFDERVYDQLFNLNVKGLLLVTQAASKVMKDGGCIINIGSFVTRIAPTQSAIYSASKGAVQAITGVLSRELGPSKIRVNSIDPGFIQTEGLNASGVLGPDMERWIVEQTPLGRIGHVGDVAPVAVFLASDDAKWITGENIIVSGGMR